MKGDDITPLKTPDPNYKYSVIQLCFYVVNVIVLFRNVLSAVT